MNLVPLSALTDNYIWMLHDDLRAVVVDPGNARVVLDAIGRLRVKLEAILVTHHHSDHTAGVAALQNATGAQVFGPLSERLPEPVTRLNDGAVIPLMGGRFDVLHVPGHTAGHLAYVWYLLDHAPVLFCGDTLFSGGCGRLFEGTPLQMLASLIRLTHLPDVTRVCCAHEYTLDCLRFAQTVEPDNLALQAYLERAQHLRQQGQPTLPSTIALEKAVNPFLRTHLAPVATTVRRFDARACDSLGVFAVLRNWKDQF
jgi:hydroxyacylglutathione hydrolase